MSSGDSNLESSDEQIRIKYEIIETDPLKEEVIEDMTCVETHMQQHTGEKPYQLQSKTSSSSTSASNAERLSDLKRKQIAEYHQSYRAHLKAEFEKAFYDDRIIQSTSRRKKTAADRQREYRARLKAKRKIFLLNLTSIDPSTTADPFTSACSTSADPLTSACSTCADPSRTTDPCTSVGSSTRNIVSSYSRRRKTAAEKQRKYRVRVKDEKSMLLSSTNIDLSTTADPLTSTCSTSADPLTSACSTSADPLTSADPSRTTDPSMNVGSSTSNIVLSNSRRRKTTAKYYRDYRARKKAELQRMLLNFTKIDSSTTADPSTNIDLSTTADPSTNIDPSTTANPSTNIDPSTTADPSTNIDPSMTADPSTSIDPSSNADNSTGIGSSTTTGSSKSAGSSTRNVISSKSRRKTAAEYHREYRARKKAELQKMLLKFTKIDPSTSASSSTTADPSTSNGAVSSNSRRKTAAQYQREYRARLKAKRQKMLLNSTVADPSTNESTNNNEDENIANTVQKVDSPVQDLETSDQRHVAPMVFNNMTMPQKVDDITDDKSLNNAETIGIKTVPDIFFSQVNIKQEPIDDNLIYETNTHQGSELETNSQYIKQEHVDVKLEPEVSCDDMSIGGHDGQFIEQFEYVNTDVKLETKYDSSVDNPLTDCQETNLIKEGVLKDTETVWLNTDEQVSIKNEVPDETDALQISIKQEQKYDSVLSQKDDSVLSQRDGSVLSQKDGSVLSQTNSPCNIKQQKDSKLHHCDICKRYFAFSSSLEAHKRHHSSGIV